MGTAFNPATTSPASWDAFTDVDAFADAVLVELASMAGTKPTRRGPKPPLTGATLRKAILAIWRVAFCGLQWFGIIVKPVARGRDGKFLPAGILGKGEAR